MRILVFLGPVSVSGAVGSMFRTLNKAVLTDISGSWVSWVSLAVVAVVEGALAEPVPEGALAPISSPFANILNIVLKARGLFPYIALLYRMSDTCQTCQCKVGLTAIKCRCGGVFCVTHRYAEDHACTFNYRRAQTAALTAALPVVVAEKISKIG